MNVFWDTVYNIVSLHAVSYDPRKALVPVGRTADRRLCVRSGAVCWWVVCPTPVAGERHSGVELKRTPTSTSRSTMRGLFNKRAERRLWSAAFDRPVGRSGLSCCCCCCITGGDVMYGSMTAVLCNIHSPHWLLIAPGLSFESHQLTNDHRALPLKRIIPVGFRT